MRNLPINLPAKGALCAALGAARLAIVGVTGTDPQAVMTRPPISETIDPNPAHNTAFEDAYQSFRAIYPAVKALQ